ncbi:MAG: TlpA family protein disulfide reductase [Burkholderiales bacterium]|nr:TlpA family protein disulfide reductase [Burkholderiales bacterium]
MPGSSWRSEAALLLALLAGPAAAFDFTLPTLEGDAFVRLQDQPGPVLVNFWGAECPPCIGELPLLLDFARRHPEWTLLLVATDSPALAKQAAARWGLKSEANMRLVRAPNAQALLRQAGGKGLPHSLAIRNGQICARHAGAMAAEQLIPWVAPCAAAPT